MKNIGRLAMALGVSLCVFSGAYANTDVTVKNFVPITKLLPGASKGLTGAEVFLKYRSFIDGNKVATKDVNGLSRNFGRIDLSGHLENTVSTVGIMTWQGTKEHTFTCYQNNGQTLGLKYYAKDISITVYITGVRYLNAGTLLKCTVTTVIQ